MDVERRIGAAIAATADALYDPSERKVVDRIESLRRELAQSSERLEIIDYGAGEPSAPVARDISAQGVVRSFEVSLLALHSSKSAPWTNLLFHLARILKPTVVIEMGTCVGLSACYLAGAMKLNGFGRLFTLEGAPTFADRARSSFDRLQLSNVTIEVGRFQDTLVSVLERTKPVDMVFNDGHHDGNAMYNYFQDTLPFIANPGVIIFDDISAYPSMRGAWNRVKTHSTVGLSIDFGAMGLCVVSNEFGSSRTEVCPLG